MQTVETNVKPFALFCCKLQSKIEPSKIKFENQTKSPFICFYFVSSKQLAKNQIVIGCYISFNRFWIIKCVSLASKTLYAKCGPHRMNTSQQQVNELEKNNPPTFGQQPTNEEGLCASISWTVSRTNPMDRY